MVIWITNIGVGRWNQMGEENLVGKMWVLGGWNQEGVGEGWGEKRQTGWKDYLKWENLMI